MAVVRWSSVARQDLVALRDYHDQCSPDAARVILKKLLGAITNLEVFPRSGRAVPEIEDQAFRELLVQGYRVVYLVTGEMEEAEVEILTIAHGSRT
jgi:plasmid stabilization system protein ParE